MGAASATTARPRRFTEHSYLAMLVAGLAAVGVALIAAVIAGTYAGDYWAQDAATRAADHVRQGVIAATGAWGTGVLLFGISMLMTAVAVALRSITRNLINDLGRPMVAALPTLLRPPVTTNPPTTNKKGRRS